MYMADDHDSCPRECVLCGERLASVRCVECGGNGSKAFPPDYGVVECEQCGGVGFAHEGCAEMSGKPKRKPATPRKTGLPVGWEETRQPRKPRKPNNRNKISDVNYMPWDEATADRFTAAALATLRRHDATDLADMLGLELAEQDALL